MIENEIYSYFKYSRKEKFLTSASTKRNFLFKKRLPQTKVSTFTLKKNQIWKKGRRLKWWEKYVQKVTTELQKIHMWLEGCLNPNKMENSWEYTFLRPFTHTNTKLASKKIFIIGPQRYQQACTANTANKDKTELAVPLS